MCYLFDLGLDSCVGYCLMFIVCDCGWFSWSLDFDLIVFWFLLVVVCDVGLNCGLCGLCGDGVIPEPPFPLLSGFNRSGVFCWCYCMDFFDFGVDFLGFGCFLWFGVDFLDFVICVWFALILRTFL